METKLPVAIVGGGPIGLAAAAHFAMKEEPFLLFESGSQVGSNFLDYSHMRLFSPWKYNIDEAAKALLMRHNLPLPEEERLPFGQEIVDDYLHPLANVPELRDVIHLNSLVQSISRKGFDKVKTHKRDVAPFVVNVLENGKSKTYEARAVIDATGTWQHPNPIGANGVYAKGETDFAHHIRYGIPDVLDKEKGRYEGKNVLVVGSGHSAINALLDLSELPDTTLHWSLRKQNIEDTYGGMEDDALPGRGALGTRIKELIESGRVHVHTPFYISKLTEQNGKINVSGEQADQKHEITRIDEIIAVTGSRPQFDLISELRYTFDASLESVPSLANLIDPNIHSCGTVRAHGEKELRQPEQNFYIVGAKSYGRAPTFLLATGYEQVRSVVAYLTGDLDGAKEVHLNLPETGVCQANLEENEDSNRCC